MHKGKSTACHEHMIGASSSSNDDDNNVSLGADQEEALVSTHDAAFSSVPSQRDPYTRKYEAHWKDDLSM
jgi:hypothetical protein